MRCERTQRLDTPWTCGDARERVRTESLNQHGLGAINSKINSQVLGEISSISLLLISEVGYRVGGRSSPAHRDSVVNSTYFGLLAEFGEANIPLARVAPKYFGLSFEEARRRAPTQMLPCPVFRLGGQKSPWLVSAFDLATLIDRRRDQAAKSPASTREEGAERRPGVPAA